MMAEVLSVKDRIVTEFEKVKNQERMRAERVQEIVREAFSQAVFEVKEGSGEIRAIAQNAISVTVEELKEKGKDAKESFANPFDAGAEKEKLKEQFTWLGKKLAELDSKLTARFSERLATAKQRLTEKARGWYGSLSEEKQAELESKFVEIKQTLLGKQQQIRQRLREMLQSTASKL
ncbi:hypothetical protein [Leptothermofonsia sp. ETS-13]|uniref:hypothetical protein n=1 Tax=Leptothermofonsia sp. ETS-13 TaxID=3035696 RepID=UPI003B9DF003